MSQLSLVLKASKSYVAVNNEGIKLFEGQYRPVADAAAAYAKEHKASLRVMTADAFAQYPAQQLEKAHRQHIRQLQAEYDVKLVDAGIKAAKKANALVLKPGYVPTSVALQAAISVLVDSGKYSKSDVLAKANAGQALSIKQVAWLMAESARVQAIARTEKKFKPVFELALSAAELPF